MTEVPFPLDPASTAGKTLAVTDTVDLLVVGASRAGIAAALEGRRNGEAVVLVDENPVPAETMGDDIPHLFGGAMSGAARNRTAMTEALLAARPGLEELFDSGVDVRLGTACWGLYANNRAVTWLPGSVAGLSDGEGASMLGFRRAVVATGCRDMGVAFPGWDLPGVSGVLAAANLAVLGAYAPRRAVLLGTAPHALAAARELVAAGVEIVAAVEVAAAPLADAAALGAPMLGAPVMCGTRVLRAEGGLDGVTALVVAGPEGERRIPCDAVLLGVGAVPVIELLDAVGCRTAFSAGAGGRVPVLDGEGRTSIPVIAAAGSCAHPPESGDAAAYRMAWVKALVVEGGEEAHVCRCEEVTARDILEVRPPRYLGAAPRPRNDVSLAALLGEGPPNPDQVKRLTRAGMGLCQGRRCREQVACLLALGSDGDLARIPPATYRAPVRPLPLRLAHAVEEPPEMRRHWDTWFGMFSQYVPFWAAPDQYTAATRPLDQEVDSE